MGWALSGHWADAEGRPSEGSRGLGPQELNCSQMGALRAGLLGWVREAREEGISALEVSRG